MKISVFSFNEYIEAVEAYINTLDLVDIEWLENGIMVYYW